MFLGVSGLIEEIGRLRVWAADIGQELLFLVVVLTAILVYAYLARIGKRWMAIPLCSAFAIAIALIMGAPFQFETSPGLPNLNPFYWWGYDTGWMLGLPNFGHFVAVVPFAVLAVAMWPPDFLGHRVFQEMNYPQRTERVMMDVDDTITTCSIRQAIGSLLGGGNITSSWGTYIVPAGIAKRPIPAGAILTGIGCILAVLIGYPMDIAMWAPVLTVALIVGVFLPLLEAGMRMIRATEDAEEAGICIVGALVINPVFGWAFAMLLSNSGVLGNLVRARSLPATDRVVIPFTTLIVCTGVMAITGLIPGIQPIL